MAKLLNSATLVKLFERQIMESATLAKVSGVGRGSAKNEPPITETDHVTQQNNIKSYSLFPNDDVFYAVIIVLITILIISF